MNTYLTTTTSIIDTHHIDLLRSARGLEDLTAWLRADTRIALEILQDRPQDFRQLVSELPTLFAREFWAEIAGELAQVGRFHYAFEDDDVMYGLATVATEGNGLAAHLGAFFNAGDSDVRAAVAANESCSEAVRELICRSDDDYAKAAL